MTPQRNFFSKRFSFQIISQYSHSHLTTTMSSHYRSLSHTLSNEGDEPSLKRAKYARQSAEKSASEDSYDGPIVRQSQHSATSLDYFPTQYHALTNCSAAEIQLWQSCQSEAVDLAGEEGVATSVVTTMSVAADSGLLQQPALVIHVPSADHEDMWRPLIISICKMLHVKDCLNLGVVIIAPPPPSSTSQFYSVRSNDPLVHLWPKLSYLKVIGKAPWSVVTVLLVGESLAQAKPTIVICTTDPNNDQWTAIEKNLKDMCREHGAGDINTLILKSSDPMLSIGELTPSGTAEQHTWTKTVESGASIGVAAKGSGTVGGHLKLLYADGKTEIVGTTNYHVIRPDHATVVATGFELLNEAWDSKYDKGEAHFDGNSPYSRAQVPSVFDHVAQQLNIQERRKKYQEELDELAHFKAKIDAGLANERTQNLYMRTQNLRDNIDVEHNRWLEPHQATATQFELATRSPSSTEAWVATHHTDLIYGEVKYTSGFRKDPAFDHRLDWALIAVAPSRNAGRNQVSYLNSKR